MPLTARYPFRQHFAVSAKEALQWCTSFDPHDHVLMGNQGVERQVSIIAEGTIILKDLFHKATGTIEKEKLVQLYPDQLSWVSTHLTGPNRYSQFLYKISADGKEGSILDFTGLHLGYVVKIGAEELAQKLCADDAAAWKLLAKAMEKEPEK